MDYRHEEFQFEEGRRIQVFDVAKKQETLHCHDCLELNRIESGTGNYIIGGKVYEICPGDIFVINNRERHLAVHKEPVRMTVILFSSEVWKDWYNQDYLKPFFQRTEDFSNQIRKKEEGYDKLDQTFSSIKRRSGTKGNRMEECAGSGGCIAAVLPVPLLCGQKAYSGGRECGFISGKADGAGLFLY